MKSLNLVKSTNINAKPINTNAMFINTDNGEFALGIPSSLMVWKRYVFKKVELKQTAAVASPAI